MQETANRAFHRLLTPALRNAIEQRASAHLGRAWQIEQIADKLDEASHPAAVLADGEDAIFVKLGAAWDQLQQEADGLRLLTARSGVLTPAVIVLAQVEETVLLMMEAIQVVPRGRTQWRQMGQALAQIHRVKGARFGLETDCYWGSLYQDNSPLDNWPDFFWTRRIEPRVRAAVDSGRLPVDFVPRLARLGRQLPQLCGPHVEPTLLHGDAHQNNFISSAHGAVLIDPAVYYGHPEMDLAYVDVFAPVPHDLLDGYRAVAAIDSGFLQRRDLWLLPFRLAMVEVDGAQHVDALEAALRPYV